LFWRRPRNISCFKKGRTWKTLSGIPTHHNNSNKCKPNILNMNWLYHFNYNWNAWLMWFTKNI
jgi:hypothetical protein